MAKLPYMQFYPADYLRDTRCLSMASRGAWMDILCALWNAPKRGIKTLTLEGWAGELGKPSSEVSLYLTDLKGHGIAKITYKKDEKICIISRRMVRDERVRKCAANRQQKQRKQAESRQESRPCHSDVTGIYQKSDIRSQNQKSESEELREEKKEKKEKKQTPLRATDDVEWLNSVRGNPAYSHLSVDIELSKMDAWLSTRPGRQKTRKFIINWLNKVERPVQINGVPTIRAAPIPPFPGPEDPIGRNSWRKAYGDPTALRRC